MGLFSFLKNAGNNILKDKAASNDASEANEAAASANKAAENTKTAELLSSIVTSSGIEIDNLSVDFNEDVATVYGQTKSVDDKEKVILILGNVNGVGAVDDRISVTAPPQSKFYEVQAGDSLSKIAQSVYGDPLKYNAIFEANQPMLSDPNKIYPGQQLRIPNL